MIRRADEVDPDRLWRTFLAAFADYLIGAPDVPRRDWEGFLRRQGVALDRSRVTTDGEEVTAFALIGPMPGRSRLACMGARPAARGTGAARALLDLVVEEATGRGDASLELEVFAQNTPAVRLYRGRGFEIEAELPGFVRSPSVAPVVSADAVLPPPWDAVNEDPPQVSLEDAMHWLDVRAEGLPYQVSAAALPAAVGPLVAWRAGEAQLVWARRSPAAVSVVSFVDDDPSRAAGRSLLRALARHAPEATLRAPQLQRLDRGGLAFEEEGWTRQELHQLLLRRPLRRVMLDGLSRRDAVLEKVIKMLRLARNAGSEAEAHTALTLAQKLMYAHDIGEAELVDGEEAEAAGRIDDAVVDTTPRHVGFKEYLAAIVGENFRCAVIISEHKASGAVRLVFVGRQADVAVASEAYGASLTAAANLAEEHVRDRPPEEQDVARGSFLTGFLKGLDARFRQNAAATALLVVADAEVVRQATALANGGDATGAPLPVGDAEALRQGYDSGFELGGAEKRLRGDT